MDTNVNANFLNPEWWKTAKPEDVEAEIKKGAAINARDSDNKTPLIHAVRCTKNSEIIQKMIDYGADVNALDGYGAPLLFDLFEDDDASGFWCDDILASMEILIKHGAKVDDDVLCSAVNFPYWNGDCYDIIKTLIEHGADVHYKTEDGTTLLMMAGEGYLYCFDDKAKALLDYGAEIDAKDSKGRTALMYVIATGYYFLSTLLSRGADVNIKDKYGITALMYLVGEPRIESGHNSGFDFDYERTHIDNVLEALEDLIKYGADINAQDNEGKTALIHAIDSPRYDKEDSIQIVEALIKHGADLNIKDNQGKTALTYALEKLYPVNEGEHNE